MGSTLAFEDACHEMIMSAVSDSGSIVSILAFSECQY